MPRVVLTRPIAPPAVARLRDGVELVVASEFAPPSPARLREVLSEAEGLLCLLTDRIDAPLLDAAPRLRAISSMSVGLDHVDLAAATARRLPVGHTPGVLTETTADLAFALLLAAARRTVEADAWVRSGGWKVWEPDLLLGRDLHGATLGIVGLGAIGQAVARRALGFRARVLGWSRTRRELPGVEWSSFDALLQASDFVTLHVALARETRQLMNANAFAQLKPGAVLVNTARGEIVDEAALVASLRSGRLAAAGLDVFEHEPLPLSSPLLEMPNVVLSPHIGSASQATRTRMAELAVDNLLAGLSGQRMPHCANPTVYQD